MYVRVTGEGAEQYDVVNAYYLRNPGNGPKPFAVATFKTGRDLLAYLHENFADTPETVLRSRD